MKPLLLVGGGGHCKSCIDVIEQEGKYCIEGIIDSKEKIGEAVLNYQVIAGDDSLAHYIKKGFTFLVTVGQIKTCNVRKRLFIELKNRNAALATIISPLARVSQYAQIGVGTIVMHGVVINAGALIEENVILNTNCLVEHDAVVGSNVHISTHAVLNGHVVIGEECFVGSNSTISNNVNVVGRTIIGAGSVVVSDVTIPGSYVGNPAKRLNK